MNVGEIIGLFKQFANESDTTFLTTADIGTYLGQGYREFRELVTELSPEIYQQSQVYTLSGVDELDLATSTPPLLNPAVTPLMTNLLHVALTSDAAGTVVQAYLDGGPSQSNAPIFGYSLEGTTLRFGRTMSAYLRLDFVADPTIQWDSGGGGYVAATIPDVLVAYHPLIALYGYRYYAIRDGMIPQELLLQTGALERSLRGYLSSGRDPVGSSHVNFDRAGLY